MRVAVYTPDGDTVFAYRFGRIHDQVDPLTGDLVTRDRIADALVKQAKAEYPDHSVVVERWVDNGDDTSDWEA